MKRDKRLFYLAVIAWSLPLWCLGLILYLLRPR